MKAVLQDRSAASLAGAIEANLFAYLRHLSSSPSVELCDTPKLTWFITGIPHPFMNGVLRTQLTPPDAPEAIERALAHLRSRQAPFMWWVRSTSQPADLEAHLVRRGLAFSHDFKGMAVDLAALNESPALTAGLTIEVVGDEDTLEPWVDAAFAGFGMPDAGRQACFDLFAGLGFDGPLHSYLGSLDGSPVATAQLFRGAGVAGIYYVSTVPEARGKGIGTAMTLTPLRQARAEGYRIGILHPSEMGLGVYRRLGFEVYCKLSHGVWMGPHHGK